VASLAYLVMTYPPLEHLVFVFPELLLVLLGITLILGRYSGYRLTELFRFRALAREREEAMKSGGGAPPAEVTASALASPDAPKAAGPTP